MYAGKNFRTQPPRALPTCLSDVLFYWKGHLVHSACPLSGIWRLSAIGELYCVYGNSSWYIHWGPLYGECLLLGGSVIRGSTVLDKHMHVFPHSRGRIAVQCGKCWIFATEWFQKKLSDSNDSRYPLSRSYRMWDEQAIDKSVEAVTDTHTDRQTQLQ